MDSVLILVSGIVKRILKNLDRIVPRHVRKSLANIVHLIRQLIHREVPRMDDCVHETAGSPLDQSLTKYAGSQLSPAMHTNFARSG